MKQFVIVAVITLSLFIIPLAYPKAQPIGGGNSESLNAQVGTITTKEPAGGGGAPLIPPQSPKTVKPIGGGETTLSQTIIKQPVMIIVFGSILTLVGVAMVIIFLMKKKNEKYSNPL